MTTDVKRGLFITLEGTEGVGKTTNLQHLTEQLAAHDIPHVVTREPGGTPLAEEIRGLLLANREEPVHGLTELLLMFAARSQHLHTFILPKLAEGTWVLCDRFTDATYAYQGGGREMGGAPVETLERLVQGDLRPDHVLLLEAPLAVGRERADARAGAADRFESEREAFFQRVQDAYRARAEADPQRYHRIDASRPLHAVQATLDQHLESIIGAWKRSH